MNHLPHRKHIFITILAILLANLLVILLVGYIKLWSVEVICGQFQARNFLQSLTYAPAASCQKIGTALTLYMILALCILIPLSRGASGSSLYIQFAAELMLAIAITFQLELCYRGIMLVPIINVILQEKNKHACFIALAGVVVLYVLADYDAFATVIRTSALDDFIRWHDARIRQYLHILVNISSYICEILWIVFVVVVLQAQADRTTEVQALYDQMKKNAQELRVANVQLSEYADQAEMMSKTAERNRIAREIHDTLGHYMTSISTGLEVCIEMIDLSPEKTKDQLIKIAKVAQDSLEDVRRSVRALRPDVLERFSLHNALQALAAEINEISAVRVDLSLPKKLHFDTDEETLIYRIVQESITNAVRHGNARSIAVEIYAKEGKAYLNIADDGCGCQQIHRGFGLSHMIERVDMLGGTIDFSGSQGFKTQVIIPVRWGNDSYD